MTLVLEPRETYQGRSSPTFAIVQHLGPGTQHFSRYPTYVMRGQDPVRDWSLVIENVSLEDDGIFQCQVWNTILSMFHKDQERSSSQ